MAGQEPTTNTTMPAPKTSPAMREFGFGADRVLRPYQNPEAKSFFRTFRPSEEERNSLGYNDYAREQDNLVLQEDLINQQLEDKQAERQQAQRKVARLEQIEDVEDQANEAIAQGVPMDQVIQQFPALAQSPSFGNYMQQVRAIAPAQQTLAPSFRKLLKTPEERADWDEGWQKFGNVTQTDDHVRARAQQRGHRVELIDAGVPLAEIEKAGPLTPERAALLKQQYKRSVTGGDPRADKVFDTVNKLISDGAEDAEVEAYLARMKKLGIDLTPPAKVEPVAAPVAGVAPAGAGGAVVQNGAVETPAGAQIDPVKEYEAIPAKSEADYLRFAGLKGTTPEFRQKVIRDLGDFMARPVPQAETGKSVGESATRGERASQVLKEAEKSAAKAEEDDSYRQALDESKTKIDEALIKMSAASGYTPEQLAETIKSEERVLFRVDGKTITPKEWLESMVGGRFHEYAAPFSRWSNTTNVGQIAGKKGPQIWGKVFESYLQEKEKTATNPAPAAPVPQADWKPGQSVAAPGGGTITRTK